MSFEALRLEGQPAPVNRIRAGFLQQTTPMTQGNVSGIG